MLPGFYIVVQIPEKVVPAILKVTSTSVPGPSPDPQSFVVETKIFEFVDVTACGGCNLLSDTASVLQDEPLIRGQSQCRERTGCESHEIGCGTASTFVSQSQDMPRCGNA